MRGVLEFDAVCWHSADPATGLVTSVLSDDLSLEGFENAVRLEVWAEDVATFPAIRRSGVRAETLSRATRGRPAESVRFREQIGPAGFGDELRAVFDAHGGMWGCAAFMRVADRGPYLARQREFADLAARHLGNALRACHVPPVGGEPDRSAVEGPAVVVLGRGNRPIAISGPAEELLGRLADPSRTSLRVPTAFVMAAEQARRVVRGLPVPQSKIRVRDGEGRWYVLHGSALKGGAEDQVTVVAAPATPADAMPLYLSAYGLTAREQEVALLLVRGCDTRDVSRLLAMKPYTVQDHLKSCSPRRVWPVGGSWSRGSCSVAGCRSGGSGGVRSDGSVAGGTSPDRLREPSIVS